MPVGGAPAPDQIPQAALAGYTSDRRSSPIPTLDMITTRTMELRRRRGLMVALIVVYLGLPALFLVIRLLLHAFAPRTNPPAGNNTVFAVLVAGLLCSFGFIVAAALGCTAGSRDLSEGMFRHLVVTGRSRLALYLARIPAGLAIVVPLVAIGYLLICAVSIFAAPSFIDDWNVNIPPGLSRAGFENWAKDRAAPVICSLPYNGRIPASVPCGSLPHTSRSAITPALPASPAVQALAVKIASRDYTGYTQIRTRPQTSVMIEAGLWVELEAVVGFTLGLGLASLMGQRLIPVILIIVVQMILTPILTFASIPHLQDVQRSFVGLAMAHLEPSGLPLVVGVPGVTGGVGSPGLALIPESVTQSVLVIIAWLAAWTILGAWRMMTRDA